MREHAHIHALVYHLNTGNSWSGLTLPGRCPGSGAALVPVGRRRCVTSARGSSGTVQPGGFPNKPGNTVIVRNNSERAVARIFALPIRSMCPRCVLGTLRTSLLMSRRDGIQPSANHLFLNSRMLFTFCAGPPGHARSMQSRMSVKRYCSLRTVCPPCPIVGVLSCRGGIGGSDRNRHSPRILLRTAAGSSYLNRCVKKSKISVMRTSVKCSCTPACGPTSRVMVHNRWGFVPIRLCSTNQHTSSHAPAT